VASLSGTSSTNVDLQDQKPKRKYKSRKKKSSETAAQPHQTKNDENTINDEFVATSPPPLPFSDGQVQDYFDNSSTTHFTSSEHSGITVSSPATFNSSVSSSETSRNQFFFEPTPQNAFPNTNESNHDFEFQLPKLELDIDSFQSFFESNLMSPSKSFLSPLKLLKSPSFQTPQRCWNEVAPQTPDFTSPSILRKRKHSPQTPKCLSSNKVGRMTKQGDVNTTPLKSPLLSLSPSGLFGLTLLPSSPISPIKSPSSSIGITTPNRFLSPNPRTVHGTNQLTLDHFLSQPRNSPPHFEVSQFIEPGEFESSLNISKNSAIGESFGSLAQSTSMIEPAKGSPSETPRTVSKSNPSEQSRSLGLQMKSYYDPSFSQQLSLINSKLKSNKMETPTISISPPQETKIEYDIGWEALNSLQSTQNERKSMLFQAEEILAKSKV